MRYLLAITMAGALCALVPQAYGQDKSEPVDSHTMLHTETRLVLVDTVVTDKKGNYIHDLTQKDFKVYEDNKEQAITSFSFESGSAANSDRKHYMVLFFDNSDAGPQQQVFARQAATKFIEANGGKNRMIAVAEFGGALRVAQNFTDDVDRLKQAVAGIKMASVGRASGGVAPGIPGVPLTAGERAAAITFGDYSIRSVLGALRNMAKGLNNVPGRKTLVFFSGGFPMTQQAMTEITATIDACNRANVAIYPVDVRGLSGVGNAPAISPLGGLPGFRGLAQLAMLGAAPLTSPLAFQGRGGATPPGGGGGSTPGGGSPSPVSGGGGRTPVNPPTTSPVPTPGNGRTNNPGMPNYPGNPNDPNYRNGIYNPMDPNNPMNRMNAMRNIMPTIDPTAGGLQQPLYALASGTGGFVIVNTNDMAGGLEKIGKEQNEYYILGYAPSKEPDPGACHTLKVKVDKGGEVVRARTGYCETKTVDVLSGTPAERDLEARITSNATPTVTGAAMQTPFFYIGPNTARVNVALEVPAGAIQFAKDKGKFHSTMNVVGIAYLKDGSVAARFSDSVKLIYDDKKEVEAFTSKPYHYEKQFEVAPGTYDLKVVFSSGASQLGRLDTPLKVEPWDAQAFSLSGLALSKNVHPANDMLGGLGSELLDDRVPLIVNGVQITPTGSNRFKKSEKGYIYAEMYEPALAVPDQKESAVPAFGIRMELLDPKTGTVKKDFGLTRLKTPPLTGNPTVPMGLILAAPDLDAGAYQLRITAMDEAGHQFARTTDILLEN
jgi:VWFA-related protein